MFVVTATGPTGVFWLSKPSELGLRTLVARNLAEIFPTLEEAEVAIKQMPEGYKFAGVSFGIALAVDLAAARPSRFSEPGTRVSDETTDTMVPVKDVQPEAETISDAATATVSDVTAGEPTARKWWDTLSKLWHR
jgi:hypothetical protein